MRAVSVRRSRASSRSPAYHAKGAAAVLGLAERDVRVAQQLGGVGRPDRSAGRGAHDELRAGDRDRLADGGRARLRGERLDVVAQGCASSAPTRSSANSSAPARARNASRRVGDRAQAPAELAQHLVAGGVAEAVVDGLEAVDVDDQDDGELALRRAAGDLLLEAVPVRRAGERRRGARGAAGGSRSPGGRHVERDADDALHLAVRRRRSAATRGRTRRLSPRWRASPRTLPARAPPRRPHAPVSRSTRSTARRPTISSGRHAVPSSRPRPPTKVMTPSRSMSGEDHRRDRDDRSRAGARRRSSASCVSRVDVRSIMTPWP